MGSLLLRFALLTFTIFGVAQFLCAEEKEPPQHEIMRQFMESYGINRSGPGLARMERGEIGWGAEENKGKIVKYIRGTEGVPFPTQQEIFERLLGTETELRAKFDRIMEQSKKAAEDFINHTPTIKICSQSLTRKRPLTQEDRQALKANKIEVYEDILVLPEEDLPKDPDQAFGKLIMVKGYKGEKFDSVAAFAEALKMNCVPTRLRVTGKFAYWQEGLDAVLNYDKNPDGNGELHPLVEHLARKYQ